MLGIGLRPFAVYALHANNAQLGVQKVLLTVKAEITRQHVRHRTGQCKQGDALPAKDLDRQTDGRQRAVGATAEKPWQPQNSATMPSAAPSCGGRPSSGAATQPKVAPVKKMGTISPPLKPAPKVSAVNSIFSRNAYGTASPLMAASMTAAPAPL